MRKKLLIGTLAFGLVGAMIFGAVNRTLARAEFDTDNQEEIESQGIGSGRGRSQELGNLQGDGNGQGDGSGQGFGNGSGRGQGNGNGQSRGNGKGNGNRGSDQSSEKGELELLSLEGVIESIDENSLVIITQNGVVVIENRAWSYAQDQGFTPGLEDQVTIEAFYDEYVSLEVASIQDLTNGQRLVLRDENGRPMWAGR
jgi:hypothetical protein